MQEKGLSVLVGCGLTAAEDRGAALVEQPFSDELVNSSARLKRGVQLNDRVRPQKSLFELTVDVCSDLLVTDNDEAARVIGVVIDETFA
jgi:hypothetical protein